MSFVDWFMASFLYYFPYSYRSSNYCEINYCRSFTLLKALAEVTVILSLSPLRAKKTNNYRYCDSWKSDNFRKEANKKKQRTDTKKDAKRIKSDNFTRGNREKLNDWMIGLHHNYFVFGGSNNISPTVYQSSLVSILHTTNTGFICTR